MLDNARKYSEEISEKLMDVWYDEKYKFYFCNNWHGSLDIPEDDWNQMCYVSIDDNNEVLGYISYEINRVTSSAYNFGAINFSNNKAIFGMDLCKVIDDIFCKFNLERMDFNVICGNPIERSYDRMVEKYGGRIVGIRRKVVKLSDNKVYDDKIYEILKEDYISRRRTKLK